MNSADRRSGKASWHADSGGFSQPDTAREAHSGHSCYYWHNSCHLCNTVILFLYAVIIFPCISIVLLTSTPHPQLSFVLVDYCLRTAMIPLWRYISIYISFWHSLNPTWSQYHSSAETVLSHYQHSEPEASSWQLWQCYLSSLICVLVWSEQRTDNFYLGYKGWSSEAVGLGQDRTEMNTLRITTKGPDFTTKLRVLVLHSLFRLWKLVVLKSSGMWTPFRLRPLKAGRIKLHAPLKRCAMALLNKYVRSSPGFSQTYKFTDNNWNGTITIKGQRNKRNKTNSWGRNCEWDQNKTLTKGKTNKETKEDRRDKVNNGKLLLDFQYK